MSAAVQSAGVALSLSIGQRVRHRDFDGKRVTGVIRGLSVDTDRVLMAHFVLDAAIVIPAINEGDREISIWHQHVPAHELAAFDDRDELIAEMLAACINARDILATDRQAFVDCQKLRDARIDDAVAHGLVWVSDGVWIAPEDAEPLRDYDRAMALIDVAVAKATGQQGGAA